MDKLIKTLSRDTEIFFEEYFTVPIIITIVLTSIVAIALFIAQKKKHKKPSILHYITIFASVFYFSELFYTTLFYRIGTKINPLSNVFGEWSIFDVNLTLYVNPKPILNIILFIPICFAVFMNIKLFFNKVYSDKCISAYTTVISFSVSMLIELLQLIFCIGTFQISDLVYNTIGGLAGAVIYISIRHNIKKTRTRA